ncbi:hypothetical protein CLV79_10413 [Limimaricola soesokkakensis]|uniref:Uncharacterized protein n=1 Tax=Limimaricola soesokkakensis TaxID=1343159 RepID=A0A1X6Z869_9RHOB|nr:hypothetical protein [Limimaricola soesokkakensis]PSK86584.1 hypothetical protein CLV79_10413 [Limimaricola soesokkakensis]SLN43802.1 hypothetical protein LOS8367_01938 [Limimaricola soesokkakensis]
MPLTFNAGSSGFDWKAALSALMEARAAKSDKTVEQKASSPAEATKAQAATEPAIRIDISAEAKTASAPAAPETVAAAVEEVVAPTVMSPTNEETTEAVAQAAAPVADIPEKAASEAVAVTEQAVVKVTSLTGLGASAAAEKTGRAAAAAPAEAEVSDIAAARAAAIRLQELDRMQNMISSIGARPESDMGIAPINAQSASRAGAAYGASAALPAAAGERTDIAA